jgi:hypothetical protein
MEISFVELRRLIELWTAWYCIGVDGWLASDESTHICTLDLPNPPDSRGSTSALPPYLPDRKLDILFLRALNDMGLQCSRLGSISFSRTCTGEEIINAGGPIVALLENGQAFFSGKRLSIFSELRRDYGDFGSHTMSLDLVVQGGQAVIHHSSLEMNNRRRGLKLELWEPLTNALAIYEEVFEQGAALGHGLTSNQPDLAESDETSADDLEETGNMPGDEQEGNARESIDTVENEQSLQASPANHRPIGLPFPCLGQAEAAHLVRLSNHIAPMRRALAEGSILVSTHPLRELAALITFVRFCEPLGVMQRV